MLGAGWIAVGFSPLGGFGWFGFSLGANSDLFYINASLSAGRRRRRCAWGTRRPPRAGTEEGGAETGLAVRRVNGAQPPAGAGWGTRRMTSTPCRDPSPPAILLPSRLGYRHSSESLITGRREKRGALQSPLRPLGPNPPPRLRVFPFVWPGLSSSYNFGGIPKEGGGGGLRKRMLEERARRMKN